MGVGLVIYYIFYSDFAIFPFLRMFLHTFIYQLLCGHEDIIESEQRWTPAAPLAAVSHDASAQQTAAYTDRV